MGQGVGALGAGGKAGVFQEGEIGNRSQAVGEKGGAAGGAGHIGEEWGVGFLGRGPLCWAEWLRGERVGTNLGQAREDFHSSLEEAGMARQSRDLDVFSEDGGQRPCPHSPPWPWCG